MLQSKVHVKIIIIILTYDRLNNYDRQSYFPNYLYLDLILW